MPKISIATPDTLASASDYLQQQDPILATVIAQVGPCRLQPHTNYYQELVQSILGQQLSLAAAAAIETRFQALFVEDTLTRRAQTNLFPTPQQILSRDIDELRSAGLSRAKAHYIQDLARHVLDGRIRFDDIDRQDNATIVQELTAVKGIGEWTVHMFLMFCMGRLDVLPTGDLGIKNGIWKLYGLAEQPKPADISRIAADNHWQPYASVASWYIWQSLIIGD